ncbi:PP2C family protein-serine/threonine phosphatase [Pseudomonadota bacterium]
MTFPILEVTTRTDKGLVREHNEDAISVLPECGVVVLADGMGGHNAGEVASEMAVQKVSDTLVAGLPHIVDGFSDVQDLLQQAVTVANQTIFEASEKSTEYKGMGTTVVVGLFFGDRLLYAHVGDSRLYLLRDFRLIPLTSDHTMLQLLVNQGAFRSQCDARAAGISSSKLMRAVGFDIDVTVDSADIKLEPEDVYLFCSDGLTNMVTDGMIGAVIQESLLDLDCAANLLLELALKQGGTDNISLVLVRPKVSILE